MCHHLQASTTHTCLTSIWELCIDRLVASRVYEWLCSGVVHAVQGHALYYGRGDLADEYFDKLGYTLPYRVNVADFILDLSSADVYTESRCYISELHE